MAILAASAIRQVLPSKDLFRIPFRIVADMLESDGSTSMATVCGSTMALMNAGVPISSHGEWRSHGPSL